jgi:hypothetical protein
VDLLHHPCSAMKRLKHVLLSLQRWVKRDVGEVLLLAIGQKKRDRIGGDIRLSNDYFVERPLFNSEEFHRMYNVNANLVLL